MSSRASFIRSIFFTAACAALLASRASAQAAPAPVPEAPSDADVDMEVGVTTAPDAHDEGAAAVDVQVPIKQEPQPAAAEEPPAQSAPPTAAPTPSSATTTTPTHAAVESTGLLSQAGYPLTPGVSALPLKPDFVVSALLQAQYESHQDSANQTRQGGQLLNQDRFSLRRGRLRVTRDFEYGQLLLELDANTKPTVRVQKAEASLIYQRSEDKDLPPLAQLTMGVFDVPFGFDVVYSSKARFFMERSTASRALFPGEPDVGVRLSGGIDFARYSIAVTNGEPADEKSGLGLQDPNSNKDITARLGAETKVSDALVIAGGMSFNRGRGFHAGTDATKNTIGWRDANENGTVDTGEEFGIPGTAAVRSENFSRWGVGADAELLLHTGLGWSMLYGELTVASNLDRGLFLADPTISGLNVRELGYYLALTQELTRYGVVGFRFDVYDPNSDFLDKRAGKQIPTSQTIRTFSPLVGLVLPGTARLLFEWDVIHDELARDTTGVPADFVNNQWTLRLQVAQ